MYICKRAGTKVSSNNLELIQFWATKDINENVHNPPPHPLTWMFCGRKTSQRSGATSLSWLNLHSGRIVLNKKSHCAPPKKIQRHAIELYKFKYNLSTQLICQIFGTRNVSYTLRAHTDFSTVHANTQTHGINYFWLFCCQNLANGTY